MEAREYIARRVVKELKNGDIVNLGIGLPTEIVQYIPDDITVVLQSENGMLNMGPEPEPGQEDQYITNAGGKKLVTVLPGGCFFDSATSFAIIRGGHVDVTVLGTLEVDQHGNLANWMVPGKIVPGMGGGMDVATGAKKVIISMEHNGKDGSPKILKQCTLPLTAQGAVDMIITEKAVFEVGPECLVLKELAPGMTVEELRKCTEAEFILPLD